MAQLGETGEFVRESGEFENRLHQWTPESRGDQAYFFFRRSVCMLPHIKRPTAAYMPRKSSLLFLPQASKQTYYRI